MSGARTALLLGLLTCAAGCASSVQVFEVGAAEGGVGPPGDAGLDARPPGDAGLDARPPADAGPDARPPEDAGPVTGSARVVSAFEHTCVVDGSGLYCWGSNAAGQLGLGPGQPGVVGRPQRVEAAEYREICTGELHTCGLRPSGQLDCWGNNGDGQLGLGDFERRASPTPLRDAPSFRSVACGGDISCALTDEGALYCWGNNEEGALGQGEGSTLGLASSTPVLVPFAQPVRQVSVGQGHVCAIAQDGELSCWGRSKNLQLGVVPVPPGEQLHTPTPVSGGGSYRYVGAGQEYTCAVRTDGRLLCWGTDFDGRLGLGATRGEVRDPTLVGEDDDYLEVHTQWFHSCALRTQGRLVCWGRNAEGQLGVGDNTSRYAPQIVEAGGESWSALAVGRFHTCGLRGGAVYCWGENEDYQQLGLGDTERRNVPTWVPIP